MNRKDEILNSVLILSPKEEKPKKIHTKLTEEKLMNLEGVMMNEMQDMNDLVNNAIFEHKFDFTVHIIFHLKSSVKNI